MKNLIELLVWGYANNEAYRLRYEMKRPTPESLYALNTAQRTARLVEMYWFARGITARQLPTVSEIAEVWDEVALCQ